MTTMPNTYLDKAIKAVPEFGNRISLFTKKLRLAQYADSWTKIVSASS